MVFFLAEIFSKCFSHVIIIQGINMKYKAKVPAGRFLWTYLFVLSMILFISCLPQDKKAPDVSQPPVTVNASNSVSTIIQPVEAVIKYNTLIPIDADPGQILTWPIEKWRIPDYELFRWDRFPTLLIFDMADYDVQNRFLKRLAFYVEKAGFRGRLVHDVEIQNLHGWNAHDYRAYDLARFFDLARKTNFPLLDEELELEKILLNEGIIRENGRDISAGQGGILSVSREAPDYLRYRFMAHEGFHGLYYVDEDFRNFTRDRWENFPADAKRFMLAFFDFQRYDIKDQFLVEKEFSGHVLQQPVAQAGDYFGRLLPSRLERSVNYRNELPQKNTTTNSWPTLASAFTAEADAFSDYVKLRWGLAAGRVWSR